MALLGHGSLAQGTNGPAPHDFAAFQIIAERNIFNSNRSVIRASTAEERPAARKDTFALVGTMSYEKGKFAFFDGSDDDFRKVLTAGDAIGGCEVVSISPSGVTLSVDGKQIELNVNSQLERENEGAWRLAARAGSFASNRRDSSSENKVRDVNGGGGGDGDGDGSTSRNEDRESRSGQNRASEASAEKSSGDDVNEVLKRLMEQREKELK